MNEMFKLARENSVGADKQCPNVTQRKKMERKVITGALAGILMLSGVLMFQENSFISYKYDSSPYPIAEIEAYERESLFKLLDQYNFNNYDENINGTRNYHYSAEDYQIIDELDESYLYSFYLNTDDNTFVEVLKLLGYSDLDDFLEKNRYLDDNNTPSIKEWRKKDKEYAIIQIKAKKGNNI